MTETEVKILEVNIAEVEAKLQALGANKIFDDEIIWTVFDYPDLRLSKSEILFRLRKKGEAAELAYKKLLTTEGAKVSEEVEISVDNYTKTIQVLEGVGLIQKRGYPMKKHRISYIFGALHIDIDTLPKLPPFLEIEGPDIAGVEDMALKMGYSLSDLKPWGLREVFAYYRGLGLVS